MAWSRSPTKMDCAPEKSVSAQREHLLSSSSVYESATHHTTCHHSAGFHHRQGQSGTDRMLFPLP